jgi:uncharacterized BrkB/YihY/UPF0761 family membrane protein
VAIFAAVAIEIAKNVYLWLWPLLDFRQAYGPFFISITLLLWGFVAALIVLAGGEISVRVARSRQQRHLPATKSAVAEK